MNNRKSEFSDLLKIMRRRKSIILLVAAASSTGAIAISNSLPVRYTSEALLLVEDRRPLVAEPGGGTPGVERTNTEADIVKSPASIDGVVHQLGLGANRALDAEPRAPNWLDQIKHTMGIAIERTMELTGTVPQPPDRDRDAVALIQSRLKTSVTENSHVMRVNFTAGSPEGAASILNQLLDRYLDQGVAAQLKLTETENKWLGEHLTSLHRDVDLAEQKAQVFRDQNQLMDISAGSLQSVQLNEQLHNLVASRQDLSRLQSVLETALQGGSSKFAGQEALASPVIQHLREREVEIAQRLAILRQRYSDSSPYIAIATTELNALHREIENESTKLIVSLRRDLQIATERVQNQQLLVRDLQLHALHDVAAAGTLSQLNREVESKRHIYNAFLTRLEQVQLTAARLPAARIISPAVPPVRPDGLPNMAVAVFGAVGGLLLAAAACIGRSLFGSRISSAADLAHLTGVPTLGAFPALPAPARCGPTSSATLLDMTQSGWAETLRALRLSVRTTTSARRCPVVLVTSSTPADGKTTLVASLAQISALDGLRVLLIEADLRRPSLARVLGAKPQHALEEFLSGSVPMGQSIYIDEGSGLHCLLANGSERNPQPLLESAVFGDLLTQAKQSYELVIIDTPPVLRVVDPIIVSRYADVILFAVAWQRTNKDMITEALRRFPEDIQARIAPVLTRVPSSHLGGLAYYQGYASYGWDAGANA